MNIELNLLTDEPDPPITGWLETELARLAALAGLTKGLVTVAVVNDEQMARLHQRYKNISGTTDVLTFDMSEKPHDGIEADVVVSLDQASRSALALGHALRLEVLLYALHGLLHLAGYDDTNASSARIMHRREDELLTAAGFGPVFDMVHRRPKSASGSGG